MYLPVPPPMLRRASLIALGLFTLATVLGTALSHAGDAPAPVAPALCNASVQHPIQVRVEALDAVQRGATVRLRVTVESRTPLGGAEVRVVSTGGAALASAARLALGRVAPGRAESREFAVRLPAAGRRFLVEFRVAGEGPSGRISRGAAFNLLPDGPAVTPRVVTDSEGRAIAESPARRIP